MTQTITVHYKISVTTTNGTTLWVTSSDLRVHAPICHPNTAVDDLRLRMSDRVFTFGLGESAALCYPSEERDTVRACVAILQANDMGGEVQVHGIQVSTQTFIADLA